jgi:hypothetical protein
LLGKGLTGQERRGEMTKTGPVMKPALCESRLGRVQLNLNHAFTSEGQKALQLCAPLITLRFYKNEYSLQVST